MGERGEARTIGAPRRPLGPFGQLGPLTPLQEPFVRPFGPLGALYPLQEAFLGSWGPKLLANHEESHGAACRCQGQSSSHTKICIHGRPEAREPLMASHHPRCLNLAPIWLPPSLPFLGTFLAPCCPRWEPEKQKLRWGDQILLRDL